MQTTNTTNHRFDRYVCQGDTSQVERNGYTFTATITPDDDTTPSDFDCYDQTVVDAWYRDEWSYVGVVVSIRFNGITLDDHAASLWGIDCNFPGSDNSYLAEVADELTDEAMTVAAQRRAEMIARLSD